MKNVKKVLSIAIVAALIMPQVEVKAMVDEVKKVVNKYDKITVVNSQEYLSSTDEEMQMEESEEVKANREGKESYELLVPKTNANYEIAISYEGGSYVYADKADTYEQAVIIAKEQASEINRTATVEAAIPTVIDHNGNTIYATEAIGRAWKDFLEPRIPKWGKICNIYTDSALTNAYTYINEDYISEMPLIQDNGTEAKVLVAGYEGWMNKNINRVASDLGHPGSDLRIYPITAVTNPSYYYVENGVLKHRFSLSMDGTDYGFRTIGLPPNYLEDGQKYSSYDGAYFYKWDDTTSATSALRRLTYDLQNGNHNQAINAGNPYYNYYSYLPFRTKTNYNAEELNSFIASHTGTDSKLRGLGQAFIDNQNKYGVNAILALGISINETGWGMSDIAKIKNNLFGLKAYDANAMYNAVTYETPAESIEDFCKNYISRGYADPGEWRCFGGFLGNKALGANVKYASDPYWSEKAISFAFQIDYELSGGNKDIMKDYNYYQLLRYITASVVNDKMGQPLYKINSTMVPSSGAFAGGVTAMVASNAINITGTSSYEVYGERTTAMNISSSGPNFGGEYDWKVRGYINTAAVQLINSGKTNTNKEDVNFDGFVDLRDLAALGVFYNKLEADVSWKDRQDINNDGIIDIFDFVTISKKF